MSWEAAGGFPVLTRSRADGTRFLLQPRVRRIDPVTVFALGGVATASVWWLELPLALALVLGTIGGLTVGLDGCIVLLSGICAAALATCVCLAGATVVFGMAFQLIHPITIDGTADLLALLPVAAAVAVALPPTCRGLRDACRAARFDALAEAGKGVTEVGAWAGVLLACAVVTLTLIAVGITRI